MAKSWSLGGLINKISAMFQDSFTLDVVSLSTRLGPKELERIRLISIYRDYVTGDRIFPTLGADGEELPYADMCYRIVAKLRAWLLPSTPRFSFRNEFQAVLEPLAKTMIEDSGGEIFFMDVLEEGGTTGDAFIFVSPDDSGDPVRIRFSLLDSGRTFAEYASVGMRKVLYRVMFLWDEYDDEGTYQQRMEVWTDEEVRVYPEGLPKYARGLVSDNTEAGADESGSYASYKNSFGEIPIIHIRNLPLLKSVYGRSDIHSAWKLAREVNEQLINYKENVEYHGNPVTLLFGISARNIEKGAGVVWGNLPINGKVENLEVTQTFPMISKYFEIIDNFTGLSSIPHYLMGTKDPIKADVSSAAMKVAFLPLLELTHEKGVMYGDGFKRMIEMGFRFLDLFGGLNLAAALETGELKFMEALDKLVSDEDLKKSLLDYQKRPFYSVEVIFGEHLPRSRTADIADITAEITAKLESVEGGMVRLGVVDPEAKKKEIMEDAAFAGEIALLSGAGTPPTGTVPPENVNQIEARTGQGADRTSAQRMTNGSGDI